MSSVPVSSQALAATVVEDVTPPGSETLATPEAEPAAEDAAGPAPDA